MLRMQVHAICSSHTGHVRKNNEDNFYFFDKVMPANHGDLAELIEVIGEVTEPVTLAVFDGMGGESNGETASYEAAKSFEDSIRSLANDYCENAYLQDAVNKMNQRVAALARQSGNRMGTTAVILCLTKKKATVCNVGDSKAFLLRNEILKQISEDHTDKEFLIKQGIRNRKPSLTQYIGVPEEEFFIEPYVKELDVCKDDVFLLCSDGLTDMLDEQAIKKTLLGKADFKDAVKQLLDEALICGGKDNITIIAIKIKGSGDA